MSVLAGSSLVWMTYTYVARQGRATGAVIAAMGVALAPGMVVHSRFQSVDMVAAAFGFGSLLAASMMLPGGQHDVAHRPRQGVVAFESCRGGRIVGRAQCRHQVHRHHGPHWTSGGAAVCRARVDMPHQVSWHGGLGDAGHFLLHHARDFP